MVPGIRIVLGAIKVSPDDRSSERFFFSLTLTSMEVEEAALLAQWASSIEIQEFNEE